MKKLKVGIISTLIVAGTALTLSGCSLFGGTDTTSQSSTDESGRVTTVYGTPWVNSITYGMVKDDTPHDEKNDWYLNTNFTYLKDTSLPEGKESAGVSVDAAESAARKVSAVISDKNPSGHDGELVAGLYGLYTDWDLREREGISYIEQLITDIRGIESIDKLNEYLSSEELKASGINLVSFDIDYDYEDPDYYSFVIVPTALSLNDSAEYSSRTSYGDMMYEGLQKRTSYILERLGLSKDESEKILSGCMEFEKAMADCEKSREFKSSDEYAASIRNKRSISELESESVGFPLTDIMRAWGLGESKRNYLLEPEWLKGLNDYYTSEHLEQLKDYLIVSVIQKYIGLSDKESFAKMLESYDADSGDGTAESYAYNFVKNKLTEPVNKLYCERYITTDSKMEAEEMCEAIISSYRYLVNENNNLSESAKEEALKKLDELTVNALYPYPELQDDYSALNIMSGDSGGTLIGATLDIDGFNWQKKLDKADKTRDRNTWDVDATQSSVSYWPTQNSVNIFAGIIDSDYYRTDMSKEEKYAGLGMLIAHEIHHALDSEGARYDEKGRNNNWWSESDHTWYQDLTKRIADDYSSYKPFKNDTPYNGERVASEALAELGGMQAVINIAGDEGLDLKKLFEAYANANKEIMSENSMQIAGLNYAEPLMFLKVNTTLKQFEEFINMADADDGDIMYTRPEDRINVW